MWHAHSGNKQNRWQTQAEHLEQVSDMAMGFASGLGMEEEARLAGILHDLGKYSPVFQDRLHGIGTGLDHWSAGAWVAIKEFRSKAAALAIQGHHIGLQAGGTIEDFRSMDPERIGKSSSHPYGLALTETNTDLLLERLRADGFDPQRPTTPAYTSSSNCASMFDVRMLFSALVDADYLDTEAHFSGARLAGPRLGPEAALEAVEAAVREIAAESTASDSVRQVRGDLWDACLASAAMSPGLFTLTAPTGAGKTLSMLAFALKHMMANPNRSTRRVIMVAPFLSIIDQTASIFRSVFDKRFGRDYVLEHHSLSGTGAEPGANETGGGSAEAVDRSAAALRDRQLCENWDSPIVVTTSVQFLESLFSNRPSAARKLHRLANSVILLDEIQTLPLDVVLPTLATLSHLSKRYGTTVVLSTATQPAFCQLDDKVRALGTSGWAPREIVPESLRLFERSRRVSVGWPRRDEKATWRDIADRLTSERQSVCIVNLKRHAVDLARQVNELGVATVKHISTSMCPRHRRSVLDEARKYLSVNNPERFCLISTQCIEAGVDGIDSPFLMRSFGPLEAIAQAAGRCNRSGAYEIGRMVVFHPAVEGVLYPGDTYQRAAQVTRAMLDDMGPERMDIYSPELFEGYYRRLYAATDFAETGRKLADAIRAQHFPEVARLYRLIENSSINVVVPYRDEVLGMAPFEDLVAEVRATGLTRQWVRKAREYTVSLFRPTSLADSVYENLEPVSLGDKLSTEWFIYGQATDYSLTYGLVPTPGSGFWNA